MIHAARVRALEEKLPDAERQLRRYLSGGGDLPSKSVGQVSVLCLRRCFVAMPLLYVGFAFKSAAGHAAESRRGP
jgi:hypothetical protein